MSRPPLLLPALSPFEQSYYAYQRKIHRALAKPLESSTSWFFKKGTASEKSFVAFDARVEKEKGDEPASKAYEMAKEEVDGVDQAGEVLSRETEADRAGDVKSLERKLDRTLYLLLKKDRKDHAWQFRTSQFTVLLRVVTDPGLQQHKAVSSRASHCSRQLGAN